MKRRDLILRAFILGAVALIAAAGTLPGIAGGKSGTKDRSRAKARHYYLKGAVSEAEGERDAAYDYYKKAVETDSTLTDALFSYGSMRMNLAEDTFDTPAERFRNLRYMRALIDANPRDLEAGELYAYQAVISDTLPEALRVYESMVAEQPGLSRLYYPLAYLYINDGRHEDAVRAIREYERLEGATTETTVKKVSYYVSAGDTAAALHEADLYAESNPGKPSIVVDHAMVYHVLGKKTEAIEILEEGLKAYPNSSEIRFDVGQMYAEMGDTASYHRYVASAFDSDDAEYEDRMEILNVYMGTLPSHDETFDYAPSDRLFAHAESLYPEDIYLHHLYSSYYVIKGDFKNAYTKMKEAFAIDPNDAGILPRLISYSILADEPREGMEAFENFTDREERNNPSTIIAYITAAQMVEEYSKALQWCDTILNGIIPGLTVADTLSEEFIDSASEKYDYLQFPTVGITYEIAGDLFAKTGDKEGTVRSYENSLAISYGRSPSTLNNYAYYIVETLKAEPGSEEFEKAKSMSRESLELTEQEPQSNYFDTYAWILFKGKNYPEALEYQELAIETASENEQSAELYSHYGDILFMNGKPEEALVQWKKALEYAPDDELLKKKVEHKTFFYE